MFLLDLCVHRCYTYAVRPIYKLVDGTLLLSNNDVYVLLSVTMDYLHSYIGDDYVFLFWQKKKISKILSKTTI